jgi:hypothetical protein
MGPEKRVFETVVCPATKTNPRNSEADIIELKDGRLLLAYTEFYHYSLHDMAPARIAGKISSDRGRSWSEPFTIQEGIGAMNVMEADLLRLKTGEIALFFCVKNSEDDCRPYMRKSADEARSWGELVPIAKPYRGYFVLSNDRAIQLSNGGILLPAAYTPNIWAFPISNITSICFYSDDQGRTWFKSEVEIRLPDSPCDEPGVVELKDGRVLMWIRTTLGRIYRSFSEDSGETWSKPEPMDLVSPDSPAIIKRIPKTDDLLIIWNNTQGPRRVPLTAAISMDDGETWKNFKNLEGDARYQYAYPSITFVDDEALITYYVHDERAGRISLKLKIAPVDWFYG